MGIKIVKVTGTQVKDANWAYSQDPTKGNYLVRFDFDKPIDPNSTIFTVKSYRLSEVKKGDDISNYELVTNTISTGENIAEYEDNDIEEKYGGNDLFYVFVPNKARSDTEKCIKSNIIATVNFEGYIERNEAINAEQYLLKTSDEKNATWTLTKEENKFDAH